MARRRISPDEFSRRLDRFVASLPRILSRAAKDVATRITARSVGRYMRDDRGGGPRSATDRGPIRILTGGLARAMNNVPGAGGIERISTRGASATLLKGVDPRVPSAAGGYNEGRIAKSGVSLSFLQPAADDEIDGGGARRRVGRIVERNLESFLDGGGITS